MKHLFNSLQPLLLTTLFGLALFNSHKGQADQRIQDDLVVVGSICAGFDCVNGESFGFDTLRLKENNLRVKFIDTSSSSSFPTRDWQITINDSANGGANWIGIEDLDAGTTPFTILASAPNDSLYISSNGNVGFGTTTPLVDVNIKAGNSPTLRLEQDTSSGFAEQTWDLGGNETNFFIRDVSNGSALPFRIMPSAPNGSLHIAADGDIGFETTTPDGLFDVAHSADGNNHAFLISPVSYVGINIDNGFVPNGLFEIQTTGGKSRFMVKSDGNVGVGTATPTGRFDIRDVGDSKSYFTVDASGNIGIGTDAPVNRFDIKNAAGDTTLFTLADSGAIGLGRTTFPIYADIEPSFMIEGQANKHHSITINTPTANKVGAFVFTKQDVAQWFLMSKNDFGADRFVLVSRLVEAMSIEQDGKIGFGVTAVGAGNSMEHSNGAVLTTAGVWPLGSSRTLKNDIVDISLDVAKSTLAALNPVTFEYKKELGETYAGFIAEDVPDIVARNDRKSLLTMDFVAILTKVVQDQQRTIEALNNRLEKLEQVEKAQ